MMYSQNDKKIGILNGFRKQNSFGRLLKIYCKFFSADLMHCPWYIYKVSKKKKKKLSKFIPQPLLGFLREEIRNYKKYNTP